MGITEILIKKHKKVIIAVIISICSLLVIYLGMAAYFVNHFYYGSTVNTFNASGRTVEEVKKQMSSDLQAYTLTIKERGGQNEQIKAADIGLKYSSDKQVENLKDRQKPLEWIPAFFNSEDYDITVGVSYDESLLKGKIDKLSCLNSSNIIEPKNPTFIYSGNGYTIANEVSGNMVNKDILYKHIADAIQNRETTIDLDSSNCYVNPKYTSKSPEVIDIRDKINKYVSSKITYTIGDKKETLDGSTINKWLSVDDNLVLTFDEKKAKEYVDSLSNKYNTVGKTRKFNASSGKTINVSRGDYGWSINKTKETQELIAAIKAGQTIAKEPEYTQTARAYGYNDIGNTYVEIDITKQHLWFYKNGSLVVQGNIVTGNVSAGHATPSGVYKLKYKERNKVLRGPGYASPVTFWMPFNGGIGIHDASWRSKFGGKIYKADGSHGCINCPYSLAKTIYNNIAVGTPIVCYY